MDLLTRFEAGQLTQRDPETIRRAIASGHLTEATSADGRRGITYESLSRWAAERRIDGFFLRAGVLADDAADDAAGPFFEAMQLLVARVALLREMHGNARALDQAGRRADARVAHDWAALAEFAQVILPAAEGQPWRVRLPAAGLDFVLGTAPLDRAAPATKETAR